MNYNVLTRNQPTNIAFKNQQSQRSAVQQQQGCNTKLLKKLREDLAGELLAINQYDEHIAEITDPRILAMLQRIRDDEITHTGEVLAAIAYLCPREEELRDMGEETFNGQNQ